MIPAARPDNYTITSKATNRIAANQTLELNLSPAGQHDNVVQRINVQVA